LKNILQRIKVSMLTVLLLSASMVAQDTLRFTNPILAGFYPDPSVCRVGSDYYLVNSTFSYFPGLPIFTSKDLVNWKLLGYALDTPEKLNLDGQGVSRGLFAPAIRYHNGQFYITCTLIDIGGNFVVTAKRPEGPWSAPVWLPQVSGIDPSLFFDDDGKAYIIFNSDPPDNKGLYPGHRTLRLYEFDSEHLKVVGDEHILVNGGTDISKKPVWIEGPHIYKVDGLYYLMAAEGGTENGHSEVIFRSKSVDGPYVPYEQNPILTQRTLDPQRKNPITSTGHADLIQTEHGNWWAVFLGCRPYSMSADGLYNTGRETFLAPVKWKDGWPIINPDYAEVQYSYPYPLPPAPSVSRRAYSRSISLTDNFTDEELSRDWMFLRTPHERWFTISKTGVLTMKLKPETCSGLQNPAFLGFRQHNLTCTASTILSFDAKAENEKAGLIIFQNEQHYYYLCVSKEKGHNAIQLFKSTKDSVELVTSVQLPANGKDKWIGLQISAHRDTYAFSYTFSDKSEKPLSWKIVKKTMPAKFLSTKAAGGFIGSFFGLYATSDGQPTNNHVDYDWFNYTGNDGLEK